MSSTLVTRLKALPPQSKPSTNPSLDSALAAPCPAVERPAAPDYDAWQEWMNELLGQYATCAARHAKTVQAWPK